MLTKENLVEYFSNGIKTKGLERVDTEHEKFIYDKNDLSLILKNIKKNKIIICDDYDQKDYGVKKAVDELRNSVTEIKELNKRLVKIIT